MQKMGWEEHLSLSIVVFLMQQAQADERLGSEQADLKAPVMIAA
jgi:hypothetical protein